MEGWLLYYHDRKTEYEQKREDILEANPGSSMVDISISRIGRTDKTGDKAVKLADLEHTGKWLEFIEEVGTYLTPEQQVFLRLRREYKHCQGRKGWTSAVQYRFTEEMARRTGSEVWIESRNTFTNWWKTIVNETAREALRRGMLP
ncbi:MAG: hypothetical protein CVU88_01090 [Firmicutes bacterium HGW-Firmicutes-13]|nr:MAG: hypothetical protein CVU88_01090 [Firmicutes bacterium HGW-Firmicutes-13]